LNETESTTHSHTKLVSTSYSLGNARLTEFAAVGSYGHKECAIENDFVPVARLRIPAAVVGCGVT
jgi:hypothetical protein